MMAAKANFHNKNNTVEKYLKQILDLTAKINTQKYESNAEVKQMDEFD